MAGKTERLQLRIAPHDRAAVKATASNLGVSLSKFVRTAVLERSDLEVALRKQSETEGGSNGGR